MLEQFTAKATKQTKFNGGLERTINVSAANFSSAKDLIDNNFKGWTIGKIEEVKEVV